jgi:PIN domain nuclease of toxin-antitoxin system
VRLLLDTHALLWWLAGDPALTETAKAAIADDTNDIQISAASAWEITTKHRIGKLPRAAPVVADLAGLLADQGFTPLPITLAHAQMAGSLPGPHRDPFDRMLIAQSLLDAFVLVSNEQLFDLYGVVRLW